MQEPAKASQSQQKQAKANKNERSWTKGPPKSTQRDPFATSWAASVLPKGTHIKSPSILTSLWAALGTQGLPKAPQKRHRGHPKELQDTSLAPCSNKSHCRCSKSTQNDSPKAPKSIVFWSLWRTVSHTFNVFLENSEYAIRSCLCNPNSIPSTPDTLQNNLETHSQEHKNTNSVAYRFPKTFLPQKWTPEACKPG